MPTIAEMEARGFAQGKAEGRAEARAEARVLGKAELVLKYPLPTGPCDAPGAGAGE